MTEFQSVILTEDLVDQLLFDESLTRGTVPAGTHGCIVEIYNGGEGFEVELFDDEGETIAVATVRPDQIRAATEQDLAARRMSA